MPEGIDMSGRQVHAIRIKLHTVADRSIIIWLNDTSKLWFQLMNPRRTWMTARTGDPVDLKHNGETSRQYIESVELYRVFPTSENGKIVASAHEWLGPELRAKRV
jgi:hypothetical protein